MSNIQENINLLSTTKKEEIYSFLEKIINDLIENCINRKRKYNNSRPFIINPKRFLHITTEYLYDLIEKFFTDFSNTTEIFLDFNKSLVKFACQSHIILFDLKLNTNYDANFDKVLLDIINKINTSHKNIKYITIEEPITNYTDDVLPSLSFSINIHDYNRYIQKEIDTINELSKISLYNNRNNNNKSISNVLGNSDLIRSIMGYVGGKNNYKKSKK